MKFCDNSFNDYFNNSNFTHINNAELYNLKDDYQKENFDNYFQKIFEDLTFCTEKIEGKDNNKIGIESEYNFAQINTENFTIPKKEKAFNDKNESNDKNENKLTKKRRSEKNSGAHTKFEDDNLIRKVKHILVAQILIFLNNKIYEIYNGDIGRGIFSKKLLTLRQKQVYESKAQFNKEFLNKTLGDIFSDNISSRYTLFPTDHNKNLINKCLNEVDGNKRKNFNKYFSLTFLDCLEHFRGSKIIKELKGLKGINSLDSKYKKDEEYLKHLKYYFNNFESIINNKRARNRANIQKYKIRNIKKVY